jgi:hypothetical protein
VLSFVVQRVWFDATHSRVAEVSELGMLGQHPVLKDQDHEGARQEGE